MIVASLYQCGMMDLIRFLLSKLQRRAARVIAGETYGVRSTQILENPSWEPIEGILEKEKLP
jgi:hypothetical protein